MNARLDNGLVPTWCGAGSVLGPDFVEIFTSGVGTIFKLSGIGTAAIKLQNYLPPKFKLLLGFRPLHFENKPKKQNFGIILKKCKCVVEVAGALSLHSQS